LVSIIAIGCGAGVCNLGANQIAIGDRAGYQNMSSTQIAIGDNAGANNIGFGQIAIGDRAGCLNSGSTQIAIGINAGKFNSGDNVIAIGSCAGCGNTLNNKFFLQAMDVNATPLIYGDFLSGDVEMYCLTLRSLTGVSTSAIGVDATGKIIKISSGSTSTGTITGATNLGSGNGVIFTNVTDNKINLKSLSGGSNVTLTCNGDYIGINSSGTGGISACVITGDSSTTGFSVCHGCNQQFVMVQVVQAASPYATVYTDVQRPNGDCVCITFSTAPALGTDYMILING
jgi:hypothetical protein